MSASNAAHSVVEPSTGTRRFAGLLVILYAIITMVPLIWIVLTSFKSPDDAISYPPKVLFKPSARRLLQCLHNTLASDSGVYPDAGAAAGAL